MAKETLKLSGSQETGWDFFCQERVKLSEREARFIGACLTENGGTLDGSWQWDGATRTFWRDVPDAKPE